MDEICEHEDLELEYTEDGTRMYNCTECGQFFEADLVQTDKAKEYQRKREEV